MANFEIIMPKLGESIEEATITNWFVKEGDKVEEDDVLINGVRIAEPYLNSPTRQGGEWTIPQDSLFVMGDNRDFSYDSRFWGYVDLKAVNGKAFIIYWSWDKQEFGVRWNRLGQLLK